MKYKVIDNFLDEEYFDSLVTLFTDKEKRGNMTMQWYFLSSISFTIQPADRISIEPKKKYAI